MSKFKYFTAVGDVADLRNQYRNLAKKWHPDRNPDRDTTAVMQAINAEYEKLFEVLKHQEGWSEGRIKFESELDAMLRQRVDMIARLKGIAIEVCGSWLWVTGETKENKEALKAAGYRFSPKKTAWYWHVPGYRRFSSEEWSLEQIRSTYGSAKVKVDEDDEKVMQALRA